MVSMIYALLSHPINIILIPSCNPTPSLLQHTRYILSNTHIKTLICTLKEKLTWEKRILIREKGNTGIKRKRARRRGCRTYLLHCLIELSHYLDFEV